MVVPYENLAKTVGQKIKDIYGRDAGYVININTEVDGTITGVELATDSTIITVDPNRFKLEQDGVVLMPEWKVKANTILANVEKIRRRLKALEELYNKNEIDKSDYDEMKRKLSSEYNKVKEEISKLKSVLKARLSELEDQALKIDKVMIALKMSYLSSEIEDKAYKSSADQLKKLKDSYSMERDDIRKTLDKLDNLDKESVELKPPTPVILTPETTPEPSNEKAEVPAKIGIKVINTI